MWGLYLPSYVGYLYSTTSTMESKSFCCSGLKGKLLDLLKARWCCWFLLEIGDQGLVQVRKGQISTHFHGGGLIFLNFHPYPLGSDPMWLIFFKWGVCACVFLGWGSFFYLAKPRSPCVKIFFWGGNNLRSNKKTSRKDVMLDVSQEMSREYFTRN